MESKIVNVQKKMPQPGKKYSGTLQTGSKHTHLVFTSSVTGKPIEHQVQLERL